MKLTPTTRFTAIIQVTLCYPAPPVKNWGIFGAKFYCPHALAGRNHRSWIGEKMLEFSSAMLFALTQYPYSRHYNELNLDIAF